ncbi:MAG: LicD family protein [Chlamydiota bacterium]
MSLANIFPKICQTFPKLTTTIVHFGLIVVYYYHLFSSSVFFNVAFDDAKGVEKIANQLLAPVHYLCGARTACYHSTTNSYQLRLRFDYQHGKRTYSPLSIYFFSPSLTLGTLLKGISLLAPNVRAKHLALNAQLCSTRVNSHNDTYRSMGLAINDFSKEALLQSAKSKRRPEDTNHLQVDKQALKAIVSILHSHEIPFWVDCGTLLGTYHYEGVIPWDYDIDIGIIADDSDNVIHALNALDPNQYCVQDWSNRDVPHSYIRVYIKENHNHIDIFHYAIDQAEKMLTFILSYENSHFMAEDWKIRERTHVKSFPFAMIFPLKKGIFDGIAVPVPRDTVGYLKLMYGDRLDPVRVYDPKTGRYEKDLSHPYWQLPLVR